MSQKSKQQPCRWCGEPIKPHKAAGRPNFYCHWRCKNKHYAALARAARHAEAERLKAAG